MALDTFIAFRHLLHLIEKIFSNVKKGPIQGFNLFQVFTQILDPGLSSKVALSRSLVSKLGPRIQLPIFSEAGFQKRDPNSSSLRRSLPSTLELRATGVPDHELQKSQEKAVKAI
jgi:hypothetical protein